MPLQKHTLCPGKISHELIRKKLQLNTRKVKWMKSRKSKTTLLLSPSFLWIRGRSGMPPTQRREGKDELNRRNSSELSVGDRTALVKKIRRGRRKTVLI